MTKFLLPFLLIFAAVLPAQRIPKAIDELRNDPRLAGASIGIDVMNLETGERVASHQAGLSMIPASTQKLITTGVALDMLGKDAVYTTRLLSQGIIKDGVLYGNLVIKGGGDPTLGSPSMPGGRSAESLLTEWTKAVLSAGIREIQGTVFGDDSYYGTEGIAMDWPWADLGNYYGAGCYGLNWHDNLYYLDLTQRQRLGATPPIQQTRPTVPGLIIINELMTAARGSGDNAYLYAAPFSQQAYLRGSIPAGTGRFTIKGSLPDPALQVAHQLQKNLIAAGVKVVLPVETTRKSGPVESGKTKILHQHRSPSVAAIVRQTNYKSVNLYAEGLLREINKSRAVPNNELHLTEVIRTYLSDELGLDLSAVQLLDGSGLSPRNYFPPAFMTAFLRAKQKDEIYLKSIPLAGRTGSMQNRLRGTAAEGRLYAKSGSLNGARAFAGYAFPRDGRRLAFSIMINNYTISNRDLNTLLYDFMRLLCESE